jgi:limonene-1,2-epoxide hydrolase
MGLTDEQMIEVLRRSTAALNREDFDAAMGHAASDIVVVRPEGLPELRGAEAVRAWLEPDAFEDQQIELIDLEARGNRVLIRQVTRARGAGSGIEVEIEALTLWTFNDAGKVSRVEAFTADQEDDVRRALDAP